MIKRIAPVGLVLAVACGGGGDGIGPTPVSSDISTMAVGDVRVLNPADVTNGIDVAAASGARDYVIIVGNTSPVLDVVANYLVKADKSAGPVFGISAAPDLGAQSSAVIQRLPLAGDPQQTVENRVRAFERKSLAPRVRSDPFGAFRLSVRRSAQAATVAVPAVGDTINLKIPNANPAPGQNLCTDYFQTRAVVASVSTKAILVVDTLDGPPALLFTPAQMDSITQEFDNVTYPTDASYFGNPTDVDGNGRVIMLFTGQINKLTPPNSPPSSGFVGGFFFGGDFFPIVDTPQAQGCAQSNGAEIFYLLSPDPTGKFGNVRKTSDVRQGTRGTIAHEFQHMINFGNRFENPAWRGFESTWLDEALAHIAEDAVGRVQRGFGDLETLDFGKLVPCAAPCSQGDDFNAFFFQNLARLTYWMQSPDKYSPTSSLADTSLATRGAAWAIVRYVADNYSGGNPRSLTRTLAAGPDTGVTNFTAAVRAPVDTVVAGWLVSMYADHLGIPGLNPQYQYRSYNFRDVMPPVAGSVLKTAAFYPLLVQSIGSGSDNISSTNRSGSGTYYRLNVAANSGAKNVKILDTSGNVASFQGEHVYVLRVQ